MPEVMIEAENLCREYRRGEEIIRAVAGVSFRLERGDFAAFVGPSGAGKTTLLQMMGAMDRPTSGTLRIAGEEIGVLGDAGLTRLRRNHIGFVFQHFGLVPTLSVEENITLPLLFSGRRGGCNVEALLERVGLAGRRRHRPSQLSGGEMQRAAIARALVNSPEILLADEPTGNLDSATGGRIVELLQALNRDGLTVGVVTHNAALAEAAARVITLRDGRIVEDTGV
jgi:putative ABC transport system ATP-binding protein